MFINNEYEINKNEWLQSKYYFKTVHNVNRVGNKQYLNSLV